MTKFNRIDTIGTLLFEVHSDAGLEGCFRQLEDADRYARLLQRELGLRVYVMPYKISHQETFPHV